MYFYAVSCVHFLASFEFSFSVTMTFYLSFAFRLLFLYVSCFFFFFFFSSRRRHTRSDRDWSSDVCSSDLTSSGVCSLGRETTVTLAGIPANASPARLAPQPVTYTRLCVRAAPETACREIGRASCRERV